MLGAERGARENGACCCTGGIPAAANGFPLPLNGATEETPLGLRVLLPLGLEEVALVGLIGALPEFAPKGTLLLKGGVVVVPLHECAWKS